MTTSISDGYLSMDMGLEYIKKDLFRSATEGDWDRVQKIYKDHPETHKAIITISGDTALHIAVSVGKEREVEEMEQLIQERWGSMAMDALKIGNELGNTPLHLAASQGNVRMCDCIARTSPLLVGIRNHDSETPFFLAALHGQKDAFLCLHHFIQDRQAAGYCYSRRSDGDTILHCAISGQYFDLAFQVIYLYENLVHSCNEKGFSPLRLLASNPSAFPSGSPVTGFEKIIYHSISVRMLEANTEYPQRLEGPALAENYQPYQACITLARGLVIRPRILLGTGKELPDVEDSQGQRKTGRQQKPQPFPPTYATCIDLIRFIVLSLGFIYSGTVKKMNERKAKHVWSLQIMDELLQRTSQYEYVDNGRIPQHALNECEKNPYAVKDGGCVEFNRLAVPSDYDSGEDIRKERNKMIGQDGENEPKSEMSTGEKTPILVAAKFGVLEMVQKILEIFPVAIHDMNTEKKNVVLLAVENRQPQVYMHLQKINIVKDSIFRKVDKNGNSALHLAATLGENRSSIPGAALQMQWEIKWYEFVENSMPRHFFVRFNKHGKTPKDIFTETHKELVTNGAKWLGDTSNACSVVAAAIATVAFATSSTVPGGVKEATGMPTLANEPAFKMFAVSSLSALCYSVMALVMFVSILTSRHQERDFRAYLPGKLVVGLTSLFISIASMLISFCGGHFFVLKDELKFAAFPIYAMICFSVTFSAVAYFPFYFELIRATFVREVPKRATE